MLFIGIYDFRATTMIAIFALYASSTPLMRRAITNAYAAYQSRTAKENLYHLILESRHVVVTVSSAFTRRYLTLS